MEYVLVTYDGDERSVFIGRRDSPSRVGPTNKILRINRGAFTFHLGDPLDYHPEKQRVRVVNTSPSKPKVIAFLSNAAIDDLSAEVDDDDGTG